MTLLDQTLEMKRSQAAEAKATARAAGLAKVARLAELMMKTEPDAGEMEELSRLMDDFDLSHEAAYEDAERFREIAEAEESIERRTKELDQIPSEQKLRADHKALDEKIEKAIAKLREPLAELEKEIERRRNIEHILDGEALRRNVYAQNLSPRVRDAFYGYGT